MDDNPVNKKSLVVLSVFSCVVILIIFIVTKGSSTIVVFCDVGQGDAAYIRTDEGVDILIDGGPEKEVLMCLGKYMPFYDRTIDIMIMSHPNLDHYGGFSFVLDRYTIKSFYRPDTTISGPTYQDLLKKLSRKHVSQHIIYATDVIKVDTKSNMVFFWPPPNLGSSKAPDVNDASLIHLFKRGSVDILFTGDTSPRVLNKLLHSHQQFGKIEILKVPHHGSKNGLTADFLRYINPVLSVISVAAQNRYGHPSLEVIEMFDKAGRTYISTAKHGDVFIELNDKNWKLIGGL